MTSPRAGDVPGRAQRLGRHAEDKLRAVVGGAARLKAVFLLACVLALNAADKATIGATAPEVERALHIGNTQIGLLVTVSTAVGAVATLPAGVLTDRINRTRLLAVAILVWSAALAVGAVSTSYLMLLMTRLALGGVTAVAGPAVASLTGDLFPAAERGRIYGFVLAGELVGTGLGIIVSGNVAAALSWRYSFWLLSAAGLVLGWVIWRRLPEPARGGGSRLRAGDERIRPAGDVEGEQAAKEQTSSPPEPRGDDDPVAREASEQEVAPHEDLVLREDAADASLWWAVKYVVSIRTNTYLIVASSLGYFFFSGLSTFAVVFLRGRFGLSAGAASTLPVVLGVGAIFGVLLTGRLSDALVRRHHIAGRPLVAGLAFLLAAGLFLPALLTTSLAIAAPLLFLAAAGIGGANPPLDAARLDLMPSRLWGRAEAVRTVLRSSFEAFAPLLFGYASSRLGGHGASLGRPSGSEPAGAIGLDRTFLIMLAPMIVAAVILLVFARRSYPRDVATAVASEHATFRSAA